MSKIYNQTYNLNTKTKSTLTKLPTGGIFVIYVLHTAICWKTSEQQSNIVNVN